MNIQLIHPPVYINKHGLTALRPSLPLGLAYIAAVLRDDGHEISVLDALGEAPDRMVPEDDIWRLGLSVDEIVAAIDDDTQAIGISSMWSYSWPIVRELIQALKKSHPSVPIVCGGEHFTAVAALSMDQAPIDFIVLGEFAVFLLDPLETLRTGYAGMVFDTPAIENRLFCHFDDPPTLASPIVQRNVPFCNTLADPSTKLTYSLSIK